MQSLWSPSDRPSVGSMSSTILLTDGSQWDQTTSVASSASTTFGAGCAQRYASCYLTAVSDMESPQELHTWSFTARSLHDTGDASVCTVPDPESGGRGIVVGNLLRYWVEKAGADQSFGAVASGTLTAGGTPQNVSGTFSPGTSGQYVRVVLFTQTAIYDQGDTIAATGAMSDFRVSGSSITPTVDYDTYDLSREGYVVLIFGADGRRKSLPMDRVGTADYTINNKGGYDTCSVPVAADYDEYTDITHGDRLQVWRNGLCRFDGDIRSLSRTERPGQANTLVLKAFGLWQRLASIPTEKEYIFQEQVDVSTFAASIANDYILPLYPDLEVNFDPLGVTSRNIDTRGRTVGEIYDQLMALVSDRAAYGIDRNPETGARRIYMRNLGTSHFDSNETPTHVFHPAVHSYAFVDSDSLSETSELVTRVRLRGSEPKYPNYLPNSSFEDVLFAGENTGNLILDGSFELPLFWDTAGGASIKRSGRNQDEGFAFEGRYMAETDNAGETVTSANYITTVASGRTYDFTCYARRENGAIPSTGALIIYWYNPSNVLVSGSALVVVTPSALYERYTYKVTCPDTATKAKVQVKGLAGDIYWDNLSLVWDKSVRQASWAATLEGGAAGRIGWAVEDSYHGGYSIQVTKTNDSGQLKVDSTAKMPTVQTQQVRLGGWFKQPAVATGSLSSIPEMYVGIREWNMEGRLVGYWEYPMPSTGYAEWTNVEITHTYSGEYDDKGQSQLYLRFNTQGVMLCDALYVRDAATVGEPYLPDGNYVVNLDTTDVFSSTGETTLYNADVTYGPGFATLDIDRNNYQDTYDFARLYFASYALPIQKPQVTINDYPTILFPGETVFFPAQDILDTEQPIMTVQETISHENVLTSRVSINRDRPTIENILRRVKRTQSFNTASSQGFTSIATPSVQAGDVAVLGGAVISVEGQTGALDLVGDGITITAGSGVITFTADTLTGVESLNSLTGAITLIEGENITITPSGNSIEIAAIALATDSTFAYINDAGVQENDTFGSQTLYIMWSQNASGTLSFSSDCKVIWVTNGRPDNGSLFLAPPAGSLGGGWTLTYEETGVFVAFDIGGGNYDVRRFL